jgi:hypothetical protein
MTLRLVHSATPAASINYRQPGIQRRGARHQGDHGAWSRQLRGKAAIEAKAVPGQIRVLYPYIRPAVEQAGPNLEAAIKANARMQTALLRQSSPVLAEHLKQNQLKIVAAYYDLASGKVTILG